MLVPEKDKAHLRKSVFIGGRINSIPTKIGLFLHADLLYGQVLGTRSGPSPSPILKKSSPPPPLADGVRSPPSIVLHLSSDWYAVSGACF